MLFYCTFRQRDRETERQTERDRKRQREREREKFKQILFTLSCVLLFYELSLKQLFLAPNY